MVKDMRQFLTFYCEGVRLAASLDQAQGKTGLLIVSGGNEIRVGSHLGMARLAADMANEGYPVFRFDRRGIGDSEGVNSGFEGSGPDLQAAISAFRSACPALRTIVAFGNCDAASALLLHAPQGLNSLILANIWTVEPTDDLPPPAAIKSHYLQRIKDPKAWVSLLSGAISFRKLVAGLTRIAAPSAPSGLADRIARAMADCPHDATLLLASQDGTALAFAEAWQSPAFDDARQSGRFKLVRYDSRAHSFARARDYAVLRSAVLEHLGRG